MADMRLKASKFSWSEVGGTSEASDLGWRGKVPRSFEVVSDRTGRVELFTFVEIMRDAEGEVTGWRFVSGGGRFRVTVYND